MTTTDVIPPQFDTSHPASVSGTRLAKRLGITVAGTENWLGAALTHSSAAGEERSGGVTGHQIEILRSLGKFYADLLITHGAYEADPRKSASDLNDARHVWRDAKIQAEKVLEVYPLGLFGKSLKVQLESEPDNRLRERLVGMLHDQLLGAMALCVPYASLRAYFAKWYGGVIRSIPAAISYKTLLQEVTQSRVRVTPAYETVSEVGPEHSKVFTICVRIGRDKSAVARGRSKRIAQEAAAEAYLKRCHPQELDRALHSVSRPRTAILHDQRRVLPQHEDRLAGALHRFEIPENKAAWLSVALTHPSFRPSLGDLDWPDNQALANLGNQVLHAGCHHRYFLRLFNAPKAIDFRASTEIYTAKALDGRAIAPFADRLGLLELTLRSSMLNLNKVDRAKCDIVAATVGAIFLSHFERRSAFDCIPSDIQRWIDSVPETAARTFDVKSPVSVLQELTQMFAVRVDYAPGTTSGPLHNAVHTASLALAPLAAGLNAGSAVTIRGGSGRSGSEAREALAAKVIGIVRSIHSDFAIARRLADSTTVNAIAKLVLGVAAERAPVTSGGALRWQIEGLLGTAHLRHDDVKSFRHWLTEALEFIRSNHGPAFPKIFQHLTSFYSEYARPHTTDLKARCRTALVEIESMMEGSDPIAQASRIRASPAFDMLGKLLRILSLSVKPRQTVTTLGAQFESLSMLHRGKVRAALTAGADVSWTEREGSMLEFLKELTSLSEFTTGAVRKVEGSMSKSQILLQFRGMSSSEAAQIVAALEQSVLFQFLKADNFVRSASIMDGLVVELCSGTDGEDFSAQFICNALTHPLPTFPRHERAAANRILHDLKNHLISAGLSSRSPQTDRTSRLRAQHDASAHLDVAKRLCEAFRTLSGASDEIRLEEISLREFFRGYCSRALLEIPVHIALSPPTTVDDVPFWTAPQLLTSIIDNLVRNGIEAIEGRGLVSINWTPSKTGDQVLIHISDSGRGLTDEKLRKLISGESVSSDKPGGSGVGMLTVISMLRRLDGTITGQSEIEKGTRWDVHLPNIRRMEYEPVMSVEDGDVIASTVNKG